MNEILAYLERCKDQAYSDRFQHSANYLMSIPLEGHEKEHAAAIRDCEIVEDLISMVKSNEAGQHPQDAFQPHYGASNEELRERIRKTAKAIRLG